MILNVLATQLGLIPMMQGPIRFAVGPPYGRTSNAWRLWTTKHGDVYVACRDNFKEAKVSLHAKGRWRMGFTTEAVAKNRALVPADQNRAWEVWDEPPASLPSTVIAFRLLFPTSELAVRPEQRVSNKWANVVYFEAAPPGKLMTLTLFVTAGDVVLTHESEPSFCLAALAINNNRRVQLVAHYDPVGNLPYLIKRRVAAARRQFECAGVRVPYEAYAYFFGHQNDASRVLFGASLNRATTT